MHNSYTYTLRELVIGSKFEFFCAADQLGPETSDFENPTGIMLLSLHAWNYGLHVYIFV